MDTSVRISDVAYANLVKSRGILETFHEKHLSLHDAVFISARFTYEVMKLLVKEMERVSYSLTVQVHDHRLACSSVTMANSSGPRNSWLDSWI